MAEITDVFRGTLVSSLMGGSRSCSSGRNNPSSIDGTVYWDQFIELLKRLKRYSLEDYLDGPVEISHCITQRPRETGQLAMLTMEYMRGHYASQLSLVAVIITVGTKLCRDDIDHVYAWYWLLSPDMQIDITPRHLVTPKIPYWRPFIELGHISLSAMRDLNSIPLACTIKRLPQLPSWCINVESAREIFVYVGDNCNAGGSRLSSIGPHIATSRDGLRIYLQGCQIDRITKKLQSRWIACHNASPHPDCALAWILWWQQAMSFAQTSSIPIEYLFRACALDDLRGPEGSPLALPDLIEHYKALVEYWSQCATGPESDELNFKASEVLRVARMKNAFPKAMHGRRLYTTTTGATCLVHHAAEVGDVLCVFEGAAAVFVLRAEQPEFEGQQSTYTFISDAWVHGFMNAEATRSDVPMQTFIMD